MENSKPSPWAETLETVRELGKAKAQILVQKMERDNVPETKFNSWKFKKQGFQGGYVNGIEEGFKLGLEAGQSLERRDVPPVSNSISGIQL